MLRRVGAPRPPSLRAINEFGGGMAATFLLGDGPEQTNIGGGKRVGLAQLP